jgi:hypothetical protein
MKINKKASLVNFGILIVVMIILSGIVVYSQKDINSTEQIGSYQNAILDSYTVAEGARNYIDNSAYYAALISANNDDYCSDNDEIAYLAEFESRFEQNLNLPEKNMDIDIVFEDLDAYKYTIENNILTGISSEELVVEKEVNSLTAGSGLNLKTTILADFSVDLTKVCNDLTKPEFIAALSKL